MCGTRQLCALQALFCAEGYNEVEDVKERYPIFKRQTFLSLCGWGVLIILASVLCGAGEFTCAWSLNMCGTRQLCALQALFCAEGYNEVEDVKERYPIFKRQTGL
ncbi:hypothetical protein I6J18_15980 [Peribacillus psychrosaccharolyticus]|uniref:Uncharacterized protein n=2 Tax=Peribacillus psychrosaccharolyticus TaxID=1407 RepID=A0A974NJY2_PERPY|nr:hypothetical protein [Peribacillus psychrosaccharolyticus]QQS99132.1 hypothetical protein I6J18_15980 [Peribacillus psychrosaccharolyticus]